MCPLSFRKISRLLDEMANPYFSVQYLETDSPPCTSSWPRTQYVAKASFKLAIFGLHLGAGIIDMQLHTGPSFSQKGIISLSQPQCH